MTVIIFVIVLAVLIFVHELGHFLFAKLNGIRVDEFKLGFGPRIVYWSWGETEYGVNIIPFGGFVKIHGENPDEESIDGPDKSRSFVNKNRFRQITVLVAGVLFNFLFAWILYVGVLSSGVTATTDGFEQYAHDFKNERIMITYVEPGSPAEKSGLQLGDVIRSVSTTTDATAAIPLSVQSIQNTIDLSGGTPVTISYSRGPVAGTVSLTATTTLISGRYAIGIAMDNVGDLQLPLGSALIEGWRYTGLMISQTVTGLYAFVGNIFHGTANFADVAGPVGIAGIVGNAAQLGFTYLVMITALISINLGVINLVPFPALDGGRVLFVLVEGLIRHRIPPTFTNTVNAVGFVILMVLMVLVTYKDVIKLINP